MPTIRRSMILLLVLCLAGCTTPVKNAAVVVSEPAVWVDGPMDGMTLRLEPYEVVFHISDPAGVKNGELSINGDVITVLSNPSGTTSPATLRYLWTPPQAGDYTLQFRAQGIEDNWSSPETVTVHIVAPTLVITPTFTYTNTTTTTITTTATSTPTPSMTPTLSPTVLTFTPSTSSDTLAYGSCDGNNVTIGVQINDFTHVVRMDLFVRLGGDAGKTDWSAYGSMQSLGNGAYQLKVRSENLAKASKYTNGTLYYQFVAVGAGEQILGRSDVYSNVALKKCADYEFNPQVTLNFKFYPSITPSKTPIIVK
jgi:hypothetical protein